VVGTTNSIGTGEGSIPFCFFLKNRLTQRILPKRTGKVFVKQQHLKRLLL